MRKTLSLVILAAAVPGLAMAACPDGEARFLRCDIAGGGKELLLCRSETQVTYRFGPKGGVPELALSTTVGEGAEIVPWPGIGRTIWEAVRLRNGNVVYEVYAGFDRFDAADPEKPDSRFGGVVVLTDDAGEIAHLKCRAGAVDYSY
ncbi:hypothetical protein [uncultured Roseovarius sp.]|uniref:hypothetical protein n=1 Tax=uncultured Roseovarius sp. TaxID=293344 RepID=UPI00260D1342|nr:hypothetical protein [uncultured Roseovarius sp.]